MSIKFQLRDEPQKLHIGEVIGCDTGLSVVPGYKEMKPLREKGVRRPENLLKWFIYVERANEKDLLPNLFRSAMFGKVGERIRAYECISFQTPDAFCMFFISHDHQICGPVAVVEHSLGYFTPATRLDSGEMGVYDHLESKEAPQAEKEKGQDKRRILADDNRRPLKKEQRYSPADAGTIAHPSTAG